MSWWLMLWPGNWAADETRIRFNLPEGMTSHTAPIRRFKRPRRSKIPMGVQLPRETFSDSVARNFNILAYKSDFRVRLGRELCDGQPAAFIPPLSDLDVTALINGQPHASVSKAAEDLLSDYKKDPAAFAARLQAARGRSFLPSEG